MISKQKVAAKITGPILLIILWDLVARYGGFLNSLFPSPKQTIDVIRDLAVSGVLWEHIGVSLIRFGVGFGIAVLIGVLLGTFLGRLPRLWEFVNPVVQLLRPISPIAWLPFIVLFIGIGDIAAIVVIFSAAIFPTLLASVVAVKKIPVQLIRTAQNFGFSGFRLYWTIILPAAFPVIVVGIRQALGAAWVFLVAGEMVGAQSGLGYLIIDGRNAMSSSQILAAIILIGAIGLILDSGITLFEKQIGKIWGSRTGGIA